MTNIAENQNKKILFFEQNDGPAFPSPEIIQGMTGGVPFIFLSEADSVIRLLETEQQAPDFIVSNSPDKNIFLAFRKNSPDGISILVTDQTMDSYSRALNFREETLLDHVISTHSGQEWTISSLRITIQKELTQDIFGITKYLKSGSVIYNRKVNHSDQRRELNNEVMNYAASLKLTSTISKLLYGISEELLMNAIYDAPTGKNGQSVYGDLRRTKQVSLSEEHSCYLSYGCDGNVFALSVTDPFGSLKKEKFLSYTKKVVRRHHGDKIIDSKQGGAGLGLFKILYSSQSLICNSLPDKQTEVISLMDVHSRTRDFSKVTRDLHFFIQSRPLPDHTE